MPRYQLLSIYDSIQRVGVEYGLRDFGGYAFNSLRLEKAYRAYGNEFTEEISALEAGMSRFVDLSRDFIGSRNLRERLEQGFAIELAYLVFDDEIACECHGNEAVFAEGEHIGLTTSGAYGFRVGRSLAFAYLRPDIIEEGLKVNVKTSVGVREAHIQTVMAFDPENKRLRS